MGGALGYQPICRGQYVLYRTASTHRAEVSTGGTAVGEKQQNGIIGATGLALLGAGVAGPIGFIIGGLAGYVIGEGLKVEP
jgi:hypothetical protein